MICKLCVQNKKLIKAHIIPDFMHRGLFDEKHQMYKVQLSLEKLPSNKIPTGEYDTAILCAECDNKISEYESYFSKVIYGGSLLGMKKFKDKDGLIFTEIINLDYTKTRLFFLSLLWRASITSRPNFSDVELSQAIEDKIREMILNDNPGEPYEFACTLTTILDHSSIEHGMIAPPRRNIDNTEIVFMIQGFFYRFYLTSKIPEKVKTHILNKKGKIDILHYPELIAKKLVNEFLGIKIF